MSNPLQCVASYQQAAMGYFAKAVNLKEDRMNTYDVAQKVERLTHVLGTVRDVVNSADGKKDKLLSENGKAFAKSIITYLRTFVDESLDEFESEL